MECWKGGGAGSNMAMSGKQDKHELVLSTQARGSNERKN